MIHKSHIWKEKLNKIIRKLGKYTQLGRWNERSMEIIEENVFISAYIIRKLREAKKLSFEIGDISIPVAKFPNVKKVDLFNWHKFDELFDLSTPVKEQLPLNNVCNVIIHSFIFTFALDFHGIQNKLGGFFIASDYTKDSELYFIKIEDYIQLLGKIVNDDKCISIWVRNSKGDFVDPREEKSYQNNKESI
jgi:hypothetical protein